MLTKITHVTLFVYNQDEALAFYQKLGFLVHTDAQFGPMRWLTLCLSPQRDVELVLMLAETEAEKALVGKQADQKPFISLECTDCLGDYQRLKVLGVSFLEEPVQQPWGISAMAQDPYGNRIYLCQPAKS